MNQKRVEDLLTDNLCIGHKCRNNSNGAYAPSLWEVAHDLSQYVKDGQLIEIPITCTLDEILEAQKYLDKANSPYLRLLELDYRGKIEKIQFKTVPGNTVYQLTFSKGDRTTIAGHFKKLISS